MRTIGEKSTRAASNAHAFGHRRGREPGGRPPRPLELPMSPGAA